MMIIVTAGSVKPGVGACPSQVHMHGTHAIQLALCRSELLENKNGIDYFVVQVTDSSSRS